ncbi:MAG: hypothetical protein ACREH5_00780 [Candidatus Omnitrophota bacterium]
MKSKSLQHIEERMGSLDPASFRYKALDCAKQFKSSWMELGRCLYSIYKDKLFKGWGYLTFEAYCSKEIGIRQPTAMKLLKSYYFLEREEPAYLKRQSADGNEPSKIPGYEAVNALRLAKTNERIPESDYRELREQVLEKAREDQEVKKKIRYILKANPRKLSPEEEEDEKSAAVARLLAGFRSAKSQLQELSFPAKVLKKIDEVIDLLEDTQR